MLKRLLAVFFFSVVFSTAFATQIQVKGVHKNRVEVESVTNELLVKNPIDFNMKNGCLIQAMIAFADEDYVSMLITQNGQKIYENYWIPRMPHEQIHYCGGQNIEIKFAEKF